MAPRLFCACIVLLLVAWCAVAIFLVACQNLRPSLVCWCARVVCWRVLLALLVCIVWALVCIVGAAGVYRWALALIWWLWWL